MLAEYRVKKLVFQRLALVLSEDNMLHLLWPAGVSAGMELLNPSVMMHCSKVRQYIGGYRSSTLQSILSPCPVVGELSWKNKRYVIYT